MADAYGVPLIQLGVISGAVIRRFMYSYLRKGTFHEYRQVCDKHS